MKIQKSQVYINNNGMHLQGWFCYFLIYFYTMSSPFAFLELMLPWNAGQFTLKLTKCPILSVDFIIFLIHMYTIIRERERGRTGRLSSFLHSVRH